MTVFGTIAGREFREIAASARYPFEDTGTMRATDGREIPDSVFLDAVIYPEDGTFGRVWIFGIKTTAEGRLDIGLMKDGLAMGSCIMSPEEGTGHVKSASGLVCGTLVARKDGLAYVAGLASYSTLFFNRDALPFRADRILPVLRRKVVVRVNGEEILSREDIPATVFASDRFTEEDGPEGRVVRLTAAVGKPAEKRLVPIKRLRGTLGDDGGTVPPDVTLAAPRWSNVQVVGGGDGITIHRRGD